MYILVNIFLNLLICPPEIQNQVYAIRVGYSRVGKGNLVLRHCVSHFPSKFSRLSGLSGRAQRHALSVLERWNENIKYFMIGNRTHNLPHLWSMCVCATAGLWRKVLFAYKLMDTVQFVPKYCVITGYILILYGENKIIW